MACPALLPALALSGLCLARALPAALLPSLARRLAARAALWDLAEPMRKLGWLVWQQGAASRKPCELEEEPGWMLLYGDVMRPPWAGQLLHCLTSSGLLLVAWRLSEHLGSLVSGTPSTATLAIGAAAAGFVAAQLREAFEMSRQHTVASSACGAALALPLHGSLSTATVAASVLPLLLGSLVGLRQKPTWLAPGGFSDGYHTIERVIPPAAAPLAGQLCMVLAGLALCGGLCSGCCDATEAVAAAALCPLLALLFTQLRLGNEDHRWWWPAFLTGAMASLALRWPLLGGAGAGGALVRLALETGALSLLASLRLVVNLYRLLVCDLPQRRAR